MNTKTYKEANAQGLIKYNIKYYIQLRTNVIWLCFEFKIYIKANSINYPLTLG